MKKVVLLLLVLVVAVLVNAYGYGIEHSNAHRNNILPGYNEHETDTEVNAGYVKVYFTPGSCINYTWGKTPEEIMQYLKNKGIDVKKVYTKKVRGATAFMCGSPLEYDIIAEVSKADVNKMVVLGWRLTPNRQRPAFSYALKIFIEKNNRTMPARANVWILKEDKIVLIREGHLIPIFSNSSVNASIGVIGYKPITIELKNKGVYNVVIKEDGSFEVNSSAFNATINKPNKNIIKPRITKIRQKIMNRFPKARIIGITMKTKNGKIIYVGRIKKPLKLFGIEIPFLETEKNIEVDENGSVIEES